jgi:hypothetical protein
MTLQQLELALMIHISILEDKGCWYKTNTDWSNYTTINGEIAHRLIYRMYIGPLKHKQEICHTCDRRGCFNPSHLFQGTHSDNMKDAINKGRVTKVLPMKRESKELRELRQSDNWKKLSRFAF